MKVFTSHWRAGEAPQLVPEGFSFSGAIWGALYLLVHRAWLAALLMLAAALATLALCRGLHSTAPLLGLFLLQGCFVQDGRRWSLARAGWRMGAPVAARDQDSALARLLDHDAGPLGREPA